MTDSDLFKFDVSDITSIEPEYYFEEKTTKGHWRVKLGTSGDGQFALLFTQVINHKLNQDDNLFEFIKSKYQDKSLSHAVADLYDIGFPVDDWVKEYIQYVLDKDGKFAAMLHIISTLRKFNEDQSKEDDLFI
jgi:hypothetical protein